VEQLKRVDFVTSGADHAVVIESDLQPPNGAMVIIQLLLE
jgi:hypothetical protein